MKLWEKLKKPQRISGIFRDFPQVRFSIRRNPTNGKEGRIIAGRCYQARRIRGHLPELRRIVFAKCQRAAEKVLLGKMQNGMESPASQSGQLEEHVAHMYLPSMREGVHSHEGIRPAEKVLQHCLFKPRQGSGEEETKWSGQFGIGFCVDGWIGNTTR
jgi:hypothetical protein